MIIDIGNIKTNFRNNFILKIAENNIHRCNFK